MAAWWLWFRAVGAVRQGWGVVGRAGKSRGGGREGGGAGGPGRKMGGRWAGAVEGVGGVAAAGEEITIRVALGGTVQLCGYDMNLFYDNDVRFLDEF